MLETLNLIITNLNGLKLLTKVSEKESFEQLQGFSLHKIL